jgi:hypothetical protein
MMTGGVLPARPGRLGSIARHDPKDIPRVVLGAARRRQPARHAEGLALRNGGGGGDHRRAARGGGQLRHSATRWAAAVVDGGEGGGGGVDRRSGGRRGADPGRGRGKRADADTAEGGVGAPSPFSGIQERQMTNRSRPAQPTRAACLRGVGSRLALDRHSHGSNAKAQADTLSHAVTFIAPPADTPSLRRVRAWRL